MPQALGPKWALLSGFASGFQPKILNFYPDEDQAFSSTFGGPRVVVFFTTGPGHWNSRLSDAQ